MSKKILLLGVFLLTLTAATCGIRQDTAAMSAREAGQPTIVFSGGGDGPRRGGIFVEAQEDARPEAVMLTITMPKLNCDRDSCATFDVVRKDGTIHPIGGISKGQYDLEFSLSALTGDTGPVDRKIGGPYRVLGEAYLQADDGEHKALLEGIVYVTVLRKGYVGVGCNGPDVAWSVGLWQGCSAQYTTKMRTVLCGDKCHDGN